MTSKNHATLLRDINAVLAGHDRALLAISSVVGVYVGLLPDDNPPRLKVMLARPDSDLEKQLPRFLEGYPVSIEITGEIRPRPRSRLPIDHFLSPC
jgi:hypothetical protein